MVNFILLAIIFVGGWLAGVGLVLAIAVDYFNQGRFIESFLALFFALAWFFSFGSMLKSVSKGAFQFFNEE